MKMTGRNLQIEEEIYRTCRVWFTILMCLCYCFMLSKKTEKGLKRLLFILPIVFYFLLLPFDLNSVYVCGMTSFFVSFLANLKLFLFAFGKGSLCSKPGISLFKFLALTLLPINFRKSSKTKRRNRNSGAKNPSTGNKPWWNYAGKCLAFAITLLLSKHDEYIPRRLSLCLFACQIYLFLELNMVLLGALVRSLFGLELAPQFDEPYISSSIQDFWGKKWNLMVTETLRLAVYEPSMEFLENQIGHRWAQMAAVMATFTVSGVMHELMFLYVGRMRPTGEVTVFFLLHGVCVVVEMGLRKKLAPAKDWRLPRWVSTLLTMGFVIVTASWLFTPPLKRTDAQARAFGEQAALVAWIKKVTAKALPL